MWGRKPVLNGHHIVSREEELLILRYEDVKPGTFTVTFDADNGTPVTTVTVEAGKTVEEPKEKPIKTGFTFKGWFVDVAPAADQASGEVRPIRTDGTDEKPYDFTTPVTADLKLKAKWEAVQVPAPDIDEQLMTEAEAEQMILSMNNDGDPKGSTFWKLQAREKSTTKNSITITWKRVSGATSYTIFENQCGKKMKKVATLGAGKNTYTQKKLKPGKYYKFIVVANGNGKALAISKMIHIATKGGKVGNVKKLTTSVSKVNLKVGKTKKIKVKTVKSGVVKNHRKNLFESSNTSVATVTANGKIKAVGKGSCFVYCYAQNGLYAKVKVV